MNLAKGAFSTSALAWKHAHPHCAPTCPTHSANADAIGAPGGGFHRDLSSGSREALVIHLPTFRSRRDLESEMSALRAEFSARLVIAAQTPRVGRLIGAGTEPEDEHEVIWEPDVVPRVDGARRRQNTARRTWCR